MVMVTVIMFGCSYCQFVKCNNTGNKIDFGILKILPTIVLLNAIFSLYLFAFVLQTIVLGAHTKRVKINKVVNISKVL